MSRVVFPRLVRISQICLLLYIVLAVLYVTNLLLLTPVNTFLSFLSGFALPPASLLESNKGITASKKLTSDQTSSSDNSRSILTFDLRIPWSIPRKAFRHDLDDNPVYMNEELLLSKAFSNSIQPSNIIPYYYRASGRFDPDDITITTIVTSNRFQVFSRLVERYRGPISVTIHLKNDTEHVHHLLDNLHTLYTSSMAMLTYVDVHLVVDSFDRQFNTWRNIARLFARTEFVMMLDIDFYLCTNFRSAFQESSVVKDKVRDGFGALVIPAFEYVNDADGTNYLTFPRDKPSLLSLIKGNRIRMFHASWAPGHNSTDYSRYYSSPPGEVYRVTRYHSAYEPYVIFRKFGPPWCDERFVGYGGNKAACLFEMYLSGISFYVLSDHFIIHQNHRYEEPIRRIERKYNRKLFADFKEETCLRYLKGFSVRGLLNVTRARNAREECRTIKGVSKAAGHLFNRHDRM